MYTSGLSFPWSSSATVNTNMTVITKSLTIPKG